MDVASLLIEAYERIPPLARDALGGLTVDQLIKPPASGANTIAWLVWHMARVQDHHVAELLDIDQLWVGGDWSGGFGLEPDGSNTGYGHLPADVATVRPERPEVLSDYLSAVSERSVGMLRVLRAVDLDRIVDRRWDPPVTLGVRLVSIADDSFQHAGQAAYVRGLLGA